MFFLFCLMDFLLDFFFFFFFIIPSNKLDYIVFNSFNILYLT